MKTSNILLSSAFILGILFFGIDTAKIKFSVDQQKLERANNHPIALGFFDKIVVSKEVKIHFAQAENNEIKYISQIPKKNGFEIKENVLYITGSEKEIINLTAPNIRQIEIKDEASITLEKGKWDSLSISASNSSMVILDSTKLNYLHVSAQHDAVITCLERRKHYNDRYSTPYNGRLTKDNLMLINHIDINLKGLATTDLETYETYHLTGEVGKNTHLEIGNALNPEIKIPSNRISIW